MHRFLLVSFITLLFCACSTEVSEPTGPEGSWWIGGVDGGVFVDVEDDENPADRIYTGTIYYDSDQTVWYQGRLRLEGEINFSPEDKTAYLGWDGERLLLIEASYLEAIDPVETL